MDPAVDVDGLRPERRPDVRRLLRPEQARAGPALAAVREAQAAVAGQDQGRQERRHHATRSSSRSVTEAAPSVETRRADPPLAGGRPALRRAARRATTSISTSRTASVARSSGRTAPARRRSSTSSAATSRRRAGTIELFGEDVTARARPGAREARSRPHVPAVAPLLGLTVEDSIYLSIVGVEGGRLRPVLLPGRDAGDPRARPRGRRPGRDRRQARRASSATSPTASIGRSRSRWRSPPSRRCSCSTSPRPASRAASAQLLTELLLGLDRDDHADPHRARHGHRAHASPSG